MKGGWKAGVLLYKASQTTKKAVDIERGNNQNPRGGTIKKSTVAETLNHNDYFRVSEATICFTL
jgi:hypothetical protein